eukprot:170379-Pelagomonas_calceolata.AAC.6
MKRMMRRFVRQPGLCSCTSSLQKQHNANRAQCIASMPRKVSAPGSQAEQFGLPGMHASLRLWNSPLHGPMAIQNPTHRPAQTSRYTANQHQKPLFNVQERCMPRLHPYSLPGIGPPAQKAHDGHAAATAAGA